MRACYLFSRLAKLLRQTLAPFLPDILVSLQPLLDAIAGDPLPPSANGLALARSTSGKGSAAFPGPADDRYGVCDSDGAGNPGLSVHAEASHRFM